MKKLLLKTTAIALLIGLVASIFVFNLIERRRERHLEITFMDARKVLIFWKSEQPSIGYISYGSNPFWHTEKEYQTSSEPAEIHAVFLDKVPLEGLYISLHTEGDSRVFWPRVHKIQYDGQILD